MAMCTAAIWAMAPAAFGAERVINSSGPLTAIHLNDNLQCQVKHEADFDFSFFSDVPGSCGTALAVRDPVQQSPTTVYGFRWNGFTLVSQSAVTGSGSSADPFAVTTDVDAGSTGLRVSRRDSYVEGDEFYRSDITVSSTSPSTRPVVLYHAADCFLQDDDQGFGFHDSSTGGIFCSRNANNSPAGRVLGFVPVSSGSHYYEARFSTVYGAVNGSDFPDTCLCETFEDNGAGLSWSFTVPAGGSVRRSLLTAVSPAGTVPDPVPEPPTITDTDPDSPANDNAPEVKGTAEPGTTVRLYAISNCSGSPVATGTAAAFASPGLTVNVANNTFTNFYATATDASGNTSSCAGPRGYVEDSTPPAAPTITDTDPDSPADDNGPEVKGSAESGSTVRLYTTSNCTGNPVATGTAAAFANPGLTASVADNSTTNFGANATDAAGNTSPCSAPRGYVEASLLPDTIAPDTPIVSGPPAFGSDNTPTFTFESTELGSTFGCSIDGGPFLPCSSPFTTAELPGGRRTFSVRATDAAGNTDPTPTVYVFEIAVELSELPPPAVGQEVNVGPVPGSGPVFIAVPRRGGGARTGARASQRGLTFVPLTEARQIPTGSFLNTRRGTVQLVSATGSRARTQSGRFSQGLFQVLQSRARRARGLTTVSLEGGNFNRCRRGRRGRAGAAQVSRRTIRRVRSNTSGNFRSRANHSAGTTLGTTWITADRCDGTLTTVRRGRVAVRDFRRKRTVIVRAGQSYLARAPR
jgi:hypothetical protein